MNRAVFLDRDGVINKLVYNPETREFESPHRKKDLIFKRYVISALRRLQSNNYLLFLVSNQPSYAKGKTTLKNIQEIHLDVHRYFVQNNVRFKRYYYCYHHPNGIIKKYAKVCKCRKPKPYFLLQAKKRYKLDMANSWFIGDQDADIICGASARVRTVLIHEKYSEKKRGKSHPDFIAMNIFHAAKIIEKHGGHNGVC